MFDESEDVDTKYLMWRSIRMLIYLKKRDYRFDYTQGYDEIYEKLCMQISDYFSKHEF
jgi:hypothetical protein